MVPVAGSFATWPETKIKFSDMIACSYAAAGGGALHVRIADLIVLLIRSLRGYKSRSREKVHPYREIRVTQIAVQPPSTGRFCPVMYLEACEAKKTTGPLMSSGAAMRP